MGYPTYNYQSQRQQYENMQNSNAYGLNQYARVGSSNYASDTYAGIIRDELLDYQNRFVPLEQQFRDMALNPTEMLDKQLERISATNKKAFERNKTNLTMMNQKFGITNTQRQIDQNNSSNDLQRGLSIAHSKNAARVSTKDRELSMLANAGGMRPDTQGGV